MAVNEPLLRLENTSKYVDSLSPEDAAAYLRKLTLSTGERLRDPCSIPENEWSSDVRSWPDVQWPDIYTYLIEKPSVYTKENLKAYKSLDAYNYLLCGHVQAVKYHPISLTSEFCVVKANVLPSQRQGHKTKLYEAWVYIHKQKSYILTANCSCMAGLGSCCSHAAAVMLKVELAVRMGLTDKAACTSTTCSWNDMARKKVEPAPLSKINFSRPKQNAQSLTSVGPKVPKTDLTVVNDQDLMELKAIFPTAAVLTSVDGGGNSETDTASEAEDEMLSLLEPLTSLYDPTAKTLPPEDVQQRCIGLMHSLQISTTTEALAQLELVTREQAKCQDWHVHRMGRVTGSVLHRVASLQDNTPRLKIVQMIMQYKRKELDLPALNWGRDMEETARKAYNTVMEQKHTDFTLTPAGLHIKKESPFLGASPDGLVSCTCCGSGVLEVKCPYKYRDGLLGCHDDPSFCMDAALELKHTHPYYYQVQLQMYVCGVQFCDFYLWTKTETVYRRITFDKTFLEMPLKKAEKLFVNHILPELLTRQHDLSIVRDEVCCKCQKPYFGKIIRCTVCLSSFHYECVHIHRASKNWKCPDCKTK